MRKQLHKFQSTVYFVFITLSIIHTQPIAALGEDGFQLRKRGQGAFCTIERTATEARVAIFGDVLDTALGWPNFSVLRVTSASFYNCRDDKRLNNPWNEFACPADGVDGFNIPLPSGSMEGVIEIGVVFRVKSGQEVKCYDPNR